MSKEPRAYFFGCWNQAGHYLHAPGKRFIERSSVPGDWHSKFDGSYAPRRAEDGSITWSARHKARLSLRAAECDQGLFLRHVVDGFTLIAWWDRCQGDTRPGCSSTFLLEGEHEAEHEAEHTSAEMLAALRVHFPHVVVNLERANVELVETHVPVGPLRNGHSLREP